MTDPSLNLEVVSNESDSSRAFASTAERRKMPRLNLSSEQFKLSQNAKVYSVVDLSTHGMALRIVSPEDRVHFQVGFELSGILNFRREKYDLKARVRHLGKDLIGCEFEGLSASVTEVLKRYLDPKILGQELKPIPSGDSAIWYHGPSGTDFFLWRGSDGDYRRMAISWLGSYVQWDEGAMTTGLIEPSFEPSEVRGVVRFETLLLNADLTVDVAKLSVAKTLLLSSNLTQDLKKWCVRQLESGARKST